MLYFSNNKLLNSPHGTETGICTSIQKQYITCIKQYIHIFSLWFSVQKQTQKAQGDYSWNDCCLLSGLCHMASHTLEMENKRGKIRQIRLCN